MSTIATPLTVTFDRNIYEFIVDADKRSTNELYQESGRSIREHITSGHIKPFISESVFTFETLRRHGSERRSTLTAPPKVNIQRSGNSITFSRDSSHYPPTPDLDLTYLHKAIGMGFKILPIFRLLRVVNPIIQPEWRYFRPSNDNMELANLFTEATEAIQETGGGFSQLETLLQIPPRLGLPWTDFAEKYTGSENTFHKCIAEWSDADAVAAHYSARIDFFCTWDQAKSAGSRSVFSTTTRKLLLERFNIRIISPEELQKLL